ncbi:SIMPL domain-containing protein [Streptomyces sp. NPDC086091]|uniref:SIMPL domain-containing protein n=1 Tax=Streptomyces sp. NPDC086091 TaxID=3365751 RepID=UPI0037F7EFB6
MPRTFTIPSPSSRAARVRARRAAVVAPLVALALLGPALPAFAVPGEHPGTVVSGRTPAPATVTVTGEGVVGADADLAVVGAGVETVGRTPQAALDAQSAAATALLAAVHGQGVADRDVRTESVSLVPVHDHSDGTARLTGYQAAQSFSVRVREVAATGALLRAVADATGEAGRIHSVAFDVADPAPLRARARESAVEDARTKALQYARLTGHRLGRLVSLSEDAYAAPRPVAAAADLSGAAFGGVPLEPGTVRATATVTAVYELD